MEDLQNLMNFISEWSDGTFGKSQRNPAIIHHLKKEVEELIEALEKTNGFACDNSVGVGEFGRQLDKTKMEYADCFMLLLDSAAHFGITADKLIAITYQKLQINKQRSWGKPDKNGVVEHIKEKNMFENLINALKSTIEQEKAQQRLNLLIGKRKKSDYIKLKIPKEYFTMLELIAKKGIKNSNELLKIIQK
jgi:NTP pyrophosphatase (non-canonical NTP hydrolase)